MLARARLVAASFFAVSTSPAMAGWQRYRHAVESNGSKERCEAPDLASLRSALRGRAVAPRGSVAHAIAALVSFSDDHDRSLPADMLPRAPTRALLGEVRTHAPGTLGTTAQLRLALGVTSDPWTALLACHLATRQLARGRDTRALGDDVPTRVEERCAAGLAIAALPAELARGGDPLGDTYHYWANVCAGVLASSRGAGGAWAIEQLFRAGPTLMTLVRERTFGSRLFYGNHAQVDALGLDHGLALSDAFALAVPRIGLRLAPS